MANDLTKIKERILYLSKYKGFKLEDFFKKIGMSYGNFKGVNKDSPINSDALERVLTVIPDVNLYWLLTGNGQMIMKKENQEIKGNSNVSNQVNDINGNVSITQNEIQKMMELQLRCIELQKEFMESLKECQQDKLHATEQVTSLIDIIKQKL